MQKKKLIIGNWKMYPQTLKEAREKFSGIKKVASGLRNVQTVVCAPAVYVGDLKKLVTGHRCVLGGQNAWAELEGAYTGEVSPAQLASIGAQYVILGHSERRAQGESDELVNKKILAALKAGLMAVVCVGEATRDSEGAYLKHIEAQVVRALAGVSKKDLSRVAIAYEPIWAIGKNAIRPAFPDDALEVSILIRRTLADVFGKDHANTLVLYGGSVDAKNAKDFLAHSNVDGLLVGRASLDPKAFTAILKDADSIK